MMSKGINRRLPMCFGCYSWKFHSRTRIEECRHCECRIECQQASLPRETPELDVPFAGEGDDDEVEA